MGDDDLLLSLLGEDDGGEWGPGSIGHLPSLLGEGDGPCVGVVGDGRRFLLKGAESAMTVDFEVDDGNGG